MGSIAAFLTLIGSEDSREIFEKVGIEKKLIEATDSLLKKDHISNSIKQAMIRNFVDMYDTLSESRYLLSPLQFKEALGKIPFGERYVGLYHFHNGIEEPPSEIDIEQSLRRRQIVMTLSREGWVFYDVVKRDLKRINIEVDNKVALQ
jgi:hypothetical protein